ncbi:hypothetical protein AG1IA_08559 [Rhizoctonia solani AG-1 IA]|uniref:Uncharacterized protein n=1 Tax=Thanatephorus cucumeris (strain AG1-IA) TaxID=983506 RepID=L8WGV3_THACA|nr:hypothetical protein AG1IA_08559 [Rhizoctonia solani AG-1 IA]
MGWAGRGFVGSHVGLDFGGAVCASRGGRYEKGE